MQTSPINRNSSDTIVDSGVSRNLSRGCSGRATARLTVYEGWIVPKGGCVLGGDGLVGGGGLTSKVATGVTWWRRLNLQGGDRCYLVAAA